MKKGDENAFFEEFLNHFEPLDPKKVIRMIISRWYWIAASVLVCAIAGFLYYQFSAPGYITSVSLQYVDKKTELADIVSSPTAYLVNDTENAFVTEKYTISSQEVITNALGRLSCPFTFFQWRNFRQTDIYPFCPLVVTILKYDPSTYDNGTFALDASGKLSYEADEYAQTAQIRKGLTFVVPGLSFQIKKISNPDGGEYTFTYKDALYKKEEILENLDIEQIEESVPVLSVSFRHPNKTFAKNFLHALLKSYTIYDLKQKHESSDLTLHFIDKQLGVYAASLKKASGDLETFRQKHTVLDIHASMNVITEQTRMLEQQRGEAAIEKSYIQLLEKKLGDTFETVNYLSLGTSGKTDAVLTNLLEQFNTLVGKRKELLIKYSPGALAVKTLDEEIVKYRDQILDNIALQKQQNARLINMRDQGLADQKKRLQRIPSLEKNLIYLQSNFDVNKNIYSLLLNKKIESSILRAGMLASFRVITLLDTEKTSPKALQIFSLSLFLGLTSGFASIFLTRYNNDKLIAIDKLTGGKIPVAGLIRHFSNKQKKVSLTTLLADQSVFAESMSSLRTTISFLKINEGLYSQKGKQILITSDQAGEGKTFISVNLALSFTKLDKKVIIIGCDLRKSQLHHFFQDNNETGLTDFLQGHRELDQIIKTSAIPQLDYIATGPTAQNPGELLQKARFEELLVQCRSQYDYVLLDTAPVGLVSDNLFLLPECHLVLFVLRWLYSENEAPDLARKLQNEYGLTNIHLVINDYSYDPLYAPLTSLSGQSYAAQYGYRYGTDSYFNKT